jgi:amidophosphoribosyltransferase
MTSGERLLDSSEKKETELHHNCGLAGFYFPTPTTTAEYSLFPALTRLQHRGQEGTGVVFLDTNGEVLSHKTKGMVDELVNNDVFRSNIHQRETKIALGHTRYSTSGTDDAWQPFIGEHIILAHNGNITNPKEFIKDFSEEKQKETLSDTHALFQLLEREIDKGVPFEEVLARELPRLTGAASLLIVDPKTQTLYGYRDPQGMRPLHLGILKRNEGYALVSEPYTLEGHAHTTYEIPRGECVKVVDNERGYETVFKDPRNLNEARCIFEDIYFSFPINNVDQFRRQSGNWLAQQDVDEGFVPDVIVPMQNSGRVYAEGYAQELSRLYRSHSDIDLSTFIPTSALVNNNYIKRVFIQPGNRDEATNLKFAINEQLVKGKKVVLVDDSLVRGTTATLITTMLKNAGAAEVHWRIGSDMIIDSCFWGIDFPDSQELIANRNEQNVDLITKTLGADSIKYIPIEESERIAHDINGYDKNYCTACFTGVKPSPIFPELLLSKK